MKTTHNQRSEQTNLSKKVDDSSPQAALDRIHQLIAAGNIDQAEHLLRSGVQDDSARNAHGVCLLRRGRYDEAVRVFRSLVLASGCTWMREDQPVIHRVNLCLALFLDGHPGGCRELLNSMVEQDHPAVKRVHVALNDWAHSLSFWKRLQWKLGLEPEASVNFSYIPGELPETAATVPLSVGAATASPQQRPASQAV